MKIDGLIKLTGEDLENTISGMKQVIEGATPEDAFFKDLDTSQLDSSITDGISSLTENPLNMSVRVQVAHAQSIKRDLGFSKLTRKQLALLGYQDKIRQVVNRGLVVDIA